MILKLIAIATLFFAMLIRPAYAEIDDYHSALLREYFLPLKWENVQHYPYWMGGETVCYEPSIGKWTFTLKPGKFTLIRLPRDEKIHIVPVEKNETSKNISIYVSNGSGLYVKKPLKKSETGETLIYTSDAKDVNVVKIANTSVCDESIKIAVFLSKKYTIPKTIRYTDEIDLGCGCNEASFVPGYEAGIQRFYRMDPNKPITVQLKGPARIRLQSRFIYPEKESTLFQAWRVNINLDGSPHRNLRFHSTFEHEYPVYLDGHKVPTSEEENAYFNIPPGDHVLQLKSSAPLYLRLLGSYCDDYLFLSNDPAAGCFDPDVTLFEYENKALKLASSNRYQYSGVLGTAMINKFQLERPDLDPLRESFDKVFNVSTFYRDILPVRKYSRCPQCYFWFTPKKMRDVDQELLPIEVKEQFLSDYIRRFDGAYFTDVPDEPDSDEPKTLEYILPRRTVPTYGRVIVELSDETYCQTFWIQLDNDAPYEVHTSEIANFACKEYRVTETDAALCILKEKFCGLAEGGTLSEAFNYFRPITAPMVESGIFEFIIPAQTKSIKIWKRAGLSKPLKLALQFRDARVFTLTEVDYLNLITDAKKKEDVLAHFMIALKKYPEVSDNDELINNWLPLIRRINSDYKTSLSSVSDPNFILNKKIELSTTAFSEGMDKANKEMNAENYPGVIKILSKLSQENVGEKMFEAKLLLADALDKQGESYLSVQERKMVFLYSENEDLRLKAFDSLEQYYKNMNNPKSLQMFYATAIIVLKDSDAINAYIDTLVTNEDYLDALYLGLLLDEASQPVQALTKAAFHESWYTLFNELVLRLENDTQHSYWMERYYRIMGDCVKADKFVAKGTKVEPSTWHRRLDLVTDYDAVRLMYSIDRDLYSNQFISTSNRPVKLTINGPAKLKLEVRPIHKKGSLTPIDGWLKVKSKDKLWLTSITGNMPSQGLELVGFASEIPGELVYSESYFPEGTHEVQITSAQANLLTFVWLQELESPLEKFDESKSAPSLNAQREAEFMLHNNYIAALKMPIGNSSEDIIRRMNLLLWVSEQGKKQYEDALGLGSALAKAHPDIPALYSMLIRLQHNSLWTLMTNVESTAGIRTIRLEGWQPESPTTQIRGFLLPTAIERTEQVIVGFNDLVYAMDNKENTTLRVNFKEDDTVGLPAQPLTALYSIDDKDIQEVYLTAENRTTAVDIQIPAGQHTIKFSIKSPLVDQVLRIKVDEKNPELAITTIDRPYYIATQEQPIKYTVSGPAWVRIDEYRDGVTHYNYVEVTEKTKTITLGPEKGQKEALYRIFTLSAMPEKPLVALRMPTVEKIPVPLYELKMSDLNICPDVIYRNTDPLLTAYTGTWSFSAAYKERLDTESFLPSQNLAKIERFHQYGAHYWYYSEPNHLYYQTNILGRPRFNGGPTFGVEEIVDYYPQYSPWSYRLEIEGYVQKPDHHRTEWSVNTAGTIYQTRHWGPRIVHTPMLKLFTRVLSMNKNQTTLYSQNQVDNDIFTKYKATHRYGLMFGDRLIYNPWLDAEVPISVNAVSGENFNLFTPDNVGASIGYRHFINGLRLEVDYRHAWYLKNKDRKTPYKSRRVLGSVTWEDLKQCYPFELEFSVQREIDYKKTLFGLKLFLHMDYEGIYRDYPTRETQFLQLRKLNLLKKTRDCEPEIGVCEE